MILRIIEVFLVSDFTVSVVPGERFDQIYAPRPHVGVHVLAGPMPTVVRITRFARTLGSRASLGDPSGFPRDSLGTSGNPYGLPSDSLGIPWGP